MYQEYNPNPMRKMVGDCTIRAISKALNQPWHKTFFDLCSYGAVECDMPNSDAIWGMYLRDQGFCRRMIPDDGFGRYTVEDFCEENPKGKFLLALPSHVVAVEDGTYFDTFDSGSEKVNYYWTRKEK